LRVYQLQCHTWLIQYN